MKLDREGNLLWGKTIGGPDDERGSYSIRETADGGYLLTGSTMSYGAGGMDIFLVKLSAFGALAWAKAIGGLGSDSGMVTLEMTDGYVILGETDSFETEDEDIPGEDDPIEPGENDPPGEVVPFEPGDKDILMVKLKLDGTLAWAKTIGGPNDDTGSGIRQVPGGFIIGATVASFGAGDADACLIKIDNSANIIWAKTIGGGQGEGISGDGIRVGSDGGYLFAGVTGSFDTFGGSAFFGIKLDSDGILQWCTMVDGPGEDAGWALKEAGDGYIGGGRYTIPGNDGDGLIVKFDETGALDWARTLGDIGLDEIGEIEPVERGYVMSGVTRMLDPQGDILVARINGNGHVGGTDPFQNINPLNVRNITPVILPCTPATFSVTKMITVTDVIPTVTIPALQVRKLN